MEGDRGREPGRIRARDGWEMGGKREKTERDAEVMRAREAGEE